MKQTRTAIALASSLVAGAALAQGGATVFFNYPDIHKQNELGTIFFASGALSSAQWDAALENGYFVLSDETTFVPPQKQSNYCVVATHFVRGNRSARQHAYRVSSRYKYRPTYNGGEIKTSIISREHKITGNSASNKFPSYCTKDAKKLEWIELEFEFDAPGMGSKNVRLNFDH